MFTNEPGNDFDFYLKFVKPLVLSLSEANERALAAAWIQKLRDENVGTARLRTDYLKLLLFVLQKRKLVGIFSENPNQCSKLEDFPETNLHDVAKALLEAETAYGKQNFANLSIGDGIFPPFSTEYSADLLEYSAAQDIPNFGVHAYYAISNKPLSNWERIEKAAFPKDSVPQRDQSIRSGKLSSSEPTLDSDFLPGKDKAESVGRESRSRRRSKSPSVSRSKSESSKQSKSPAKLKPVFADDDFSLIPGHKIAPEATISTRGLSPSSKRPVDDVPVSPPLGTSIKEKESREAPTWGSNLISVSEPPRREFTILDLSGSSAYPSLPYRTPPLHEELLYSPQFPDEEIEIFQETPPSFLVDRSLSYEREAPVSHRKASPAQKRVSYSPQLPSGDGEPFFMESPPSFFKDQSILSERKSTSPKAMPQYVSSPRYSPSLPQEEREPFFMESPPSFFKEQSMLSERSFKSRSISPKAISQQASSPRYSPTLPQEEREPFFMESPPSFFKEQSMLSERSSKEKSPCDINAPCKALSAQEEALYSPPLPQGEVEPVFLESPPSFIKEQPTMLDQKSLSPKTSSEAKTLFKRSPPLPEGDRDYFFLETPPSFFENASLSPEESPKATQPTAVVIAGREYDKNELQILGLDESALGSDIFDVGNLGDFDIAQEPEPSYFEMDKIERQSIDDDLDAFDRMIAEYEQEEKLEKPPSPYVSPRRSPKSSPVRPSHPPSQASPPKSPAAEAKPAKKIVKRKKVVKKKKPLKPEEEQQAQTGAAVQKPSAVPAKKGAVRKVVKKSISKSEISTKAPASKTTLSVKETTRIPKTSQVPMPTSKSRIPVSEASGIPIRESRSRIPVAGTSRIPTAGSYRPLTSSKSGIPIAASSKMPVRQRSGIPTKKQAVPYSPAFPEGEVEPFFLETPPSFLDAESLPSLDSSGYPSLPYRTPSPKRYFPPGADVAELTVSLPYRTPTPRPERDFAPLYYSPPLPEGEVEQFLLESPPSFLEADSIASSGSSRYPSLPYKTPSPRPKRAGPDYNLNELQQLGLQPEDLNEDIFNLDKIKDLHTSQISVTSEVEYEELPAEDQDIDRELDEWDRRIAELEAEHAEDIALYGSPKETARFPADKSPPKPIAIAPGSPRAQDIIDAANKQLSRSPGWDFEQQERLAEAEFPSTASAKRRHPPLSKETILQSIATAGQASRQYKELVKYAELDEEYQKRYSHRRPDVPRTPPVFSKYRSVMGADADREYYPSEFGLTEEIEWQPAEQFLEGKVALSPRTYGRRDDAQDFLKTERPDLTGMEKNFNDTAISERSPAKTQTEVKKVLQDTSEELAKIKQTSPAEGGLPITTPHKSTSPRRTGKSIRVESEAGEISFELPVFESPREDKLHFESPPKEFYESPGQLPLSPKSIQALPDPFGLPKPLHFSPIKPARLLQETLQAEPLQSVREWDLPQVGEQSGIFEETPPMYPESPPPMSPIIQKQIQQKESPRLTQQSRIIKESPRLTQKQLSYVIEEQTGIFEESPPMYPESPPIISPKAEKLAHSVDDRPYSVFEQPKPFDLGTEEIPEHFYYSPRASHAIPLTPPQFVEGKSPLAIEEEAIPEELYYSPTFPPITPPRRTRPPSPESPVEDRVELMCRLFGADEPPYYSLEEMTIPQGRTFSKRRVMPRRSPVPPLHRLREIPEQFPEEHVPFLAQVEAARPFPRPTRRMMIPSPQMETVREKPIIVPREPPPDDLMEHAHPVDWSPPYTNVLDTSVPRELSRPLRPRVKVPGWTTPPHLKKRSPEKSDFGLTETQGPRDILNLELPPEEMQYSPPPLSPSDFVRKTPRAFQKQLLPSDSYRRQIRGIFEESPPQELQYLSPPKISPRPALPQRSGVFQESPPTEFYYTSPSSSPQIVPRPSHVPKARTMFYDSENIAGLGEEAPPEDFYYSPTFPPITPPRRSRPPSPESPPEDRIDLMCRLFGADEPPYYSLEEMTIPQGRTFSKRRVMPRKSPAPSLHRLREIPEQFPEEHMPFLVQVEAAKPFQKRSKRMQVRAPGMDTIGESPVVVPNAPLPDDLMGENRPMDWSSSPTLFDRPLTKDLHPTLKPYVKIPGWKTPPQLQRKTRTTEPQLLTSRASRGVIDFELPPEELQYSPPPLSPRSKHVIQPYSRISKAPSVKYKDIRKVALEGIDVETQPEDLYYSPDAIPIREESPPKDFYYSPEAVAKSPSGIREETPPEDFYYSPTVSPNQLQRQRPPPSPQSPPEDRVSLMCRLFEADEPPYYSLEEMTIPRGRTSSKRMVVERKSPAPLLHTIRELPHKYEEKHVPFLAQVEAAKPFSKRTRRLRITSPKMGPILESPARVPNAPLPGDLMGEAVGVEWSPPSPTIIERPIPEKLKPPLKPLVELPGWRTPPHLKRKSPEREMLPTQYGPRDVVSLELPPTGLQYSPPPLSPDRAAQYRYVPKPLPSPGRKKAIPIFSDQADISIGRERPPMGLFYSPESKTPSPVVPPRDVFKDVMTHAPPYLAGEMPPDDFLLATTPPSSGGKRQPSPSFSPDSTLDSFERHEREMVEFYEKDDAAAPVPQRISRVPSPKQQLRQIQDEIQKQYSKLLEETPGKKIKSPRFPIERQTIEDRAKAEALELEEFEAAERRINLGISDRLTPPSKVVLDRVKHLISDVPEPALPRRPPRPIEPIQLQSPKLSPKLPRLISPKHYIQEEPMPQEIAGYVSPRTPKESPVQEAQIPYGPPPPTIFDVQSPLAEYLEAVTPPYDVMAESPEYSPPTPPSIDDYYTPHTPPRSPGSPGQLQQSVQAHKFTDHFYDTRKRLMTGSLHIKNKAMPLRGARPPSFSPIKETIEEIYEETTSEGGDTSTTRIVEKTTEAAATTSPRRRYRDLAIQNPPDLFEGRAAGPSLFDVTPPEEYGYSPPQSPRSPGRRIQEKTVTIIETEEPSEYDVAVSQRIPFADHTSPEILDTSLIPSDLDESFVTEDISNFKWLG